MDKRGTGKMLAKMIVGIIVGTFVKRTLETNVPSTEKFHVSELTGAVAGKVVSDKFEPKTDKFVDDFFDSREAKSRKY